MLLRFLRYMSLVGLCALSACGGGGDSGSNGGDGDPPSGSTPPPGPSVKVTLAASQTAIQVGDSVTLTWSSDGNGCTATNGWFGSKSANGTQVIGPFNQTLTFSLSCVGTATTASGQASVTVQVADFPLPPPTATKVVADSRLTTLDYVRVNVRLSAVFWDANSGNLFATSTSDSPTAPNALVVIDPLTGSFLRTAPLAASATAVTVSANGAYVYVGFGYGSNGEIRRFKAADLALDKTFTVGSEPLSSIERIAVSPVSAEIIAVIAGRLTASSTNPGLVIVDDGVSRPSLLAGSMQLPGRQFPDAIWVANAAWSPDGTRILVGFGPDDVGSDEFIVDSQGVSTASGRRLWGDPGLSPDFGERFYSSGRGVLSRTGPVQVLGRLPDYYYAPGALVAAPRGKIFSVQTHLLPGSYEDGLLITAFDLERLTYIDSIVFNGAALIKGGVALWGTDGLAIVGQDLILAHGSFAASGHVPLPDPDLLSVIGGNSQNANLSYRMMGIAARDVAADSCGHLYVATDASSAVRPSSVVEIDFETGLITRAVHLLGEPYHLAVSDDCSTLYAGLDASNSIARVRLSDMTVEAVLPLGFQSPTDQTPLHAKSVSVAPGLPRTVAVMQTDLASGCLGWGGNVAIFDDLTKRPVDVAVDTRMLKAVAWGGTASTLYGEDTSSVYQFSVDANGLGNQRTLFPNRIGTYIDDLGRDLRFDRGKNRLFNALGDVFDTAAGTELTPLIPPESRAIISSCGGTPTIVNASDPVNGRVFYVSYDVAGTLTVSAYDGTTLNKTGSAVIREASDARVLTWPLRVARPNANGLAVVTVNGQLLLMKGSLLAR